MWKTNILDVYNIHCSCYQFQTILELYILLNSIPVPYQPAFVFLCTAGSLLNVSKLASLLSDVHACPCLPMTSQELLPTSLILTYWLCPAEEAHTDKSLHVEIRS